MDWSRLTGLAWAALLSTGCSSSGPDFTGWDGPLVAVDPGADLGPVSPLVFGANHRAGAAAAGSADPGTGRTFDAFAEQVEAIGVTALRFPGGTTAGTYRWERAVGPQSGRRAQVAGSVSAPVPLASTFGPDEFGDLLERTGAVGVLMLNIATGTPAAAADLVAYMSLPLGSPSVHGVDWAALRARNGHPAPYPIAYAEVGNEPFGQGQDQRYWMGGEVTTIDPACAATPLPCLYALGGSTRFTRQPAVGEDDWRWQASLSSGEANQVFWARFPPVAPGSLTVFVDGTAWPAVASLAGAAAEATRCQVDPASGRITFGDGVHGAVPPDGAAITLSYVSGPHGGYVDFAAEIKAVRPDLKLCSTFDDPAFLQIMGGSRGYDCHVIHPYVGLRPSAVPGVDDELGRVMQLAEEAAGKVTRARADIARFAGARAPAVELALTEYGLLPGQGLVALPGFLRSQGMGVLQALLLRQWILGGVTLAMRHALTDFTFGGAPSGLETFFVGDQALIQGPGPGTVPSPSALALELVRRHTGRRLVASEVSRSPVRTLSDGVGLPGVVAFATSDEAAAYVVVINQDPSRFIDVLIAPADQRAWGQPTGQLLAAAADAMNTPAAPDAVRLVDVGRLATDRRGAFRFRSPALSVAAFRLPRK